MLEPLFQPIPTSFERVQFREFRQKVPDIQIVTVDAGDRTVSDSFGRTLAADVFPKIPRIEVAGTIQKHYQIVSKPVFECF